MQHQLNVAQSPVHKSVQHQLDAAQQPIRKSKQARTDAAPVGVDEICAVLN